MKPFTQDVISLIKEETRIFIGQNEFSAGLFRSKRPHLTVSKDTEIVIEGAPSSGNSFAINAFNLAQTRQVHVAHHQHLPFQVTIACRNEIPCLILLREPSDAVISRVSRYGFYETGTAQAKMWVDYSLRHWVMFHEMIMGYSQKFVVSDFREVTRNYAAAIERVNARFGTSFQIPTSEHCSQALSMLVQGVKPSAEREIRKSQFKEWMQQEKKFRKTLDRAEQLYATFLSYNAS